MTLCDDLNLRILRMLDGTFSLDAAYMVVTQDSTNVIYWKPSGMSALTQTLSLHLKGYYKRVSCYLNYNL